MSNDPLRRAFDEVRASTLPRIRRPGVTAARQTLRRRRNVRLAAVLVALLVCGLSAALAPWNGPAPHPPVSSESPEPSPSASPLVSPSATPQGVGDPSAPPCAGDGRAVFVRRSGNTITVRFSPDGGPNAAGVLPCPGFFVGVFYNSWQSGNHNPSVGDRKHLDSTHLTATMTVWDAADCVDWLVGYHYSGINKPEPWLPAGYPGSVDWGQSPPRSTGAPYFWDTRHNRSAILDGARSFGACPTATPTP
jgi:hypothetical protein